MGHLKTRQDFTEALDRLWEGYLDHTNGERVKAEAFENDRSPMIHQMYEAVCTGNGALKEKRYFGKSLTREDAKIKVNTDGTTELYWGK